MAQVPDLMSLLSLDPRQSRSSLGGHHRTILISKDFTNTGDFVFNNLLHYFSRKEPSTPLLLVTLEHDWSNYSSIAAKCGSNLRRAENMGNIEVLNMMEKFLDSFRNEKQAIDIHRYMLDSILAFIKKHTPNGGSSPLKPIIVMIDNLSILSAIGTGSEEIYRLFSTIDMNLRKRSTALNASQSSFLVLQSEIELVKSSNQPASDDNLNYMVSNIENQCDIVISLKPLDTGFSTRVDGTIKIVDNRLAAAAGGAKSAPGSQADAAVLPALSSMLTLESRAQIGLTRAFFYKLSDRRARLTSSALIMSS